MNGNNLGGKKPRGILRKSLVNNNKRVSWGNLNVRVMGTKEEYNTEIPEPESISENYSREFLSTFDVHSVK